MTNPELPFQILSELAGQEEPTPATLADITAAADILDETVDQRVVGLQMPGQLRKGGKLNSFHFFRRGRG